MLQDYARILQRSTSAVMGEKITYNRKGLGVVPDIQATRGRQLSRVTGEFGALLVKGEADWIVSAADLVYETQSFTPVRGDIITDESGAQYEVWPTSHSKDCYMRSDHEGFNLRIHTRRVNA